MMCDPEALAELLRAARPDAEPSELSPDDLDDLARELGVDPEDAALMGRALVAWERLLP